MPPTPEDRVVVVGKKFILKRDTTLKLHWIKIFRLADHQGGSREGKGSAGAL